MVATRCRLGAWSRYLGWSRSLAGISVELGLQPLQAREAILGTDFTARMGGDWRDRRSVGGSAGRPDRGGCNDLSHVRYSELAAPSRLRVCADVISIGLNLGGLRNWCLLTAVPAFSDVIVISR